MKYSIVAKQNLNNESRLDAEFFAPEIIQAENCIAKHKNDEIARIANVIHPTEIERIYSDAGIQILLAQNVRNNCLCFDIKSYMPEEKKRLLSSNLLNYNDVLVTRTGANFGQAASYKSTEEIYACADLLVVKCNKILGGYLSTFFNTKYGRLMLDRGVYGAAQPHISSLYLKQLKVPRFNNVFEEMTDKLLNKSHSYTCEINACYENTYKIFVNELGIKNWQPKHELSYVKNFSDVSSANRYDAEYFQHKYDEIIEKIKLYPNGWDTIGNLFDQNRDSFIVKKDNKYKYIEIGSINTSNGEITFEEIQGNDLPANAKIKIHTNDILISKVRTYRGAVAVVENSDSIGSGAFTVLHEKLNSQINKETLYTFFKLKPILDLTLKYNTGTSYPTITDEDILNMPIPIFKQNIQNEIREKIQEAKKLQTQSKQLLEIAKRGVEIAIEENEDIATEWINEQLLKIGVTL